MPTKEITPLTQGTEPVGNFSRLFDQDLYLEGRTRFWGNWNPVAVPFDPNDQYFRVTEPTESRLDLISYKFYQTPEMWWLLAEVNNIFFPFEDLKIGDELRIPAKSTLFSLNIIR